MRRYLLCAVLSLACCLPAGGAEPPIVLQEGQLFTLSSRLVEVQTGEGTKLFAPATEESSAGVLCTTTVQGTGHLWWIIGPGSQWIPVWATADLAVFTPSVAGEYLILLAVQQASGQWQQLHIRAEIGGGPDPPPPPPPEGPYQIAIFHESDFRDNMTMDQVELVNGLVFREALEGKGHSWLGSFDIEEAGPGTGKKIPERVKAWFEKASGHTMPVLCFSPLEGGPIVVHPLPADAAGVWKLLGGAP